MKRLQKFLNVLMVVSICLTVGIGVIGANTLSGISLYSSSDTPSANPSAAPSGNASAAPSANASAAPSANASAAPDSTATDTVAKPKSAIDSIPAPPGVHQVSQVAIDNIDDYSAAYPIDLKTPDNITRSFDYDPVTGEYVLHSRVGDMDISTPIRLTPKEYAELTRRQKMQGYWREKNKDALDNYEDKFNITDMKFSLGPAEKVFGPGGVRIKMQGSAELKFGIKYNNIQNYTLSERLRKTTTFDFDENIQLNVNATVGDRIKFGMNYNTEASFEYDQTKIKLSYEGKDDDIIKAIEVGNVSLPLNTQLITGSQALFGMRAALQFGKLSIDAIVAQQQAQSQQVSSQGGAQLMDFEVDVNNYDENRHFFLAHYFRDNFETSMATMPYATSGINITRCEVWVTNKRNNFEQTRNFVAFMDLGEYDKIGNPHWSPVVGAVPVPANESNTLYDEVKKIPGVRDVQQCNAALDAKLNAYSIYGGQDYEKVESARKLTESEYTLNPQLGFISLKQQLNQDEVLAVAFEFTFNGKTYQVGELSTDGVESPNSLILKMLKGTAVNTNTPLFKLMMKNIYYLGGTNMQQEKFKLQIQYKNDSSGVYVNYLPEGECANQLLVRVMNLDQLDTKNERHPDGKFDFVEGYTVYASSGRIILPSPEPFGNFLRKKINNDAIADKYCFQELYDSTLVAAGEFAEKNKFRIAGEFQATSGSVIQLGAMNVPRGSVKVTTGGQELVENVDYTVDYTMGTVTILNQSILASGNNIDVKLENQNTFNMQRRTLVGTHLEYAVTKDFSVGGTLMHLTEMPMVTKTAVGAEPIANTIWGVNMAYRNDAAWLTKAVDAIPGINATAPSSIVLNAEVAQMIPGHRKVDGNPGYAYLDDFESTETTIDLRYPYYWRLCATPYDEDGRFPESTKSNNVDYGKNRARFNWYVIDNTVFNRDNSQTPNHLRADKKQLSNHITREVIEQEIFPNKESIVGQSSTLAVMNVSFYPEERGPYNLDLNVDPSTGKLNNPTKRWGGMFRRLETSDFETANIQYIKFWMMDPFVNDSNGTNKGGDLYFNLGDVSEDILKDGKKFFENGMPINGDTLNTSRTVWGRVPTTQSTVLAFDGSLDSRQYQDVGLDGLRTVDEKTFTTYNSFVAGLRAVLSPALVSQMEADPYSPINDPASDNYHHYRGTDYDNEALGILARYKYYNNPEGNSPASDNTTETYSTSATTVPDAEDVNQDNTLNEYEKYFEYKISIRPEDMYVGVNNIVDAIVADVEMADGTKSQVTWYQFKIPINSYNKRIGSINNFRSVRFVRMYMTDFEKEMHLRFGTLELVRGDWKHYTKPLYNPNNPPTSTATMDVTAVSIEENDNKTPVNYVLPPEVTRATDPSQPQITQQNEQSMLIKVIGLAPDDARAVYKNLRYDMRRYKRIQMFAHAEALMDTLNLVKDDLKDYECSVFLRIGSDQTQNYYEYEIPLKLTPWGHYVKWDETVWPNSNMFDFPLSLLTDIKNKRNASLRKTRGSMATAYSEYDPDNMQNKITIVGNPNLGEVKTMMIGIRNHANTEKSVEVWVNELRLTEYDEKASWAATGNLGINFSDVGSFNVSARYEQAGFGSIEQSLSDRRMDDLTQVNLSAQWDFGRFVPEKVNMRIPVYYSYGEETKLPLYSPTDEDIKLKDALSMLETKEERDSLKSLSRERNITQSFNITNMKVELKGKKPRVWDPGNFSVSYAFTQSKDLDPETARDFTNSHNAQFNYNFTTTPESWEPFKTNKKLSKWKIFTEWGMNYEPSILAFNVNILRTYQETQLRDLTGAMQVDFSDPHNSLLSYSKDFTWSRNFQIKYDITKNISLQLQTNTNSRFDETKDNPVNKELFPTEYEQWKDTVRKSIAQGGRPLAYQQTFTASWNIPINKIPEMDWVTAKAQYSATYNWSTGLSYDDTHRMGNTISNLAQWQGDGQMNFATLYGKSKYVKDLNNKLQQRSTGRGNNRSKYKEKTFTKTLNVSDTAAVKVNHKLNSAKIDVLFTNRRGKVVDLKYRIIDNNNIEIRKSRASMDSVKVTIKTKDPNALSGKELAELYGVRFLLLVRKLQVSYKGSNSVSLPGYDGGGKFFGQSVVNGKLKPGLDFAFGVPNEKYVQACIDNEWIIIDDAIVNQSTVNKSSDFDIKLSLEPIPNFKVELESKRVQSEMVSVQQANVKYPPTTYSGAYRITTCMLATTFVSSGKAENNYKNATFEKFLDYRSTIAGRIEEKYAGTQYPTGGFMEDHRLAGQTYDPSKGGVNLNSADVLIPAFLAAYSGTSANSQSLDIFPGFLSMLPNWKVTYDGLGKLKSMQKVFKSFSLTHGYQCSYNVGSYNSYTNYASIGGNMGFVKDVTTGNPVPSSPYNITSVNITEALNPLIGVDMAFKNSFTAKVEYKRQRTLTLNVTASQIMEAKNNEWVVGVGYVLKDFDIMLKLKQNKTKKVKNDLTLRCDFSIKDIATLLRKMDETFTTQATNGNKTFGFKISAEYVFSSMLSFKLYCDYQNNAPYISTSYPVETCDFGLAVKFMLTR